MEGPLTVKNQDHKGSCCRLALVLIHHIICFGHLYSCKPPYNLPRDLDPGITVSGESIGSPAASIIM
jgi:hypothetical protein